MISSGASSAGFTVSVGFASSAGFTGSAGFTDSDSFTAGGTTTVCLDTGPRLATIAAASAAIGEESGLLGSSALGVEGPDMSLGKRGLLSAGDLFEGKVLLRCTPEVVGVPMEGVTGLGRPDCRDRFEDVDTFLRTPLPSLRTLSAPTLDAADTERPMPELLRPGVVGVLAWGVGGPLSTCLTVPSSTAVPSMPIRK
jgi:hypothetical protein